MLGNGNIGACSIASPNYLPLARTVASSYIQNHPKHRFFVLIVARDLDRAKFSDEPFEPVFLEDLGLANLPALAMKYGILELNTNVKPRLLLHLLQQEKLAQALYLDPDIYVYSSFEPIFELLDGNNAVLTPHLTVPSMERIVSFEQEFLFNGTYNLGFAAFSNTQESIRLLEWWDRRCQELGYSEGRTGLFVDQKWINLVPGLFNGIAVCKHIGCNMAVWNLEERRLSRVADRYQINGDQDLCFFHFSGIALDSEEVLFRNTDRFTPSTHPEIADLFNQYRSVVRTNRRPSLDSIDYGFDHFEDGTAVTLLARRIFGACETRFGNENPFSPNSKFQSFARRRGLLAGNVQPKPERWTEFRRDDKRVQGVHNLLRLALKLLGPNRYELLMKYLGFISVLRNQASFLKD